MFRNLEMNSDRTGRTHSVESFQRDGTRLAEETEIRPKPKATIGGQPIFRHSMNIDSAGGGDEFVITLSRNSDLIEAHFLHSTSSITTYHLSDSGGLPVTEAMGVRDAAFRDSSIIAAENAPRCSR